MLFKPMLPLLEYAVFYDYIKNELCVNKDKPEMECNGKCYLKKELAKASDSERDQDKHHIPTFENQIVFCEINIFRIPFSFSNETVLEPVFTYNKIYSYSFSKLIFRPPLS
ncbi:MAG: hypothetical protein ACTIJ9_13550 [Aequorivita sp.]